MSDLVLALAKIQQTLKVPKGQTNSFGKYKYRNCEDILKALTPLLGDCILTLSDEIVMVGERYYIKATACLQLGSDKLEVTAYAREDLAKKGMDVSQLTGSTSSYARKYALNGLFSIDDTADADSMDNRQQSQSKPQSKPRDFTKDIAAYWATPEDKRTGYWSTLKPDVQQAIQAANHG